MKFNDPYNRHIRKFGKEAEREIIRMNIINDCLTSNRIKKALRSKEYLGSDHGYLKANEVDIVNNYRTQNKDLVYDRLVKYNKALGGLGKKNYNVNRITVFRDIPDGIEILIDYVDVIAIRAMNIPTEIIYESIYRELPELFEE